MVFEHIAPQLFGLRGLNLIRLNLPVQQRDGVSAKPNLLGLLAILACPYLAEFFLKFL